MKKYVILLAGGKGSRMNASVNKVLMSVCGIPVIIRSMSAFSGIADEMIIVARPEDQSVIRKLAAGYSFPFPFRLVSGGETRQASVTNGLRSLSPDGNDVILIHDAARCLVDGGLISRVIESVSVYGTGIPGIPAVSTFKICDHNSFIVNTPDRSSLYEIQTPQGFAAEIIIPAALKAADDQIDCTDDAGILEYYHIPARLVHGSPSNIKLTEPQDIVRAKAILEGDVSAMRIGMGYDVHRFAADRKLILCGVEIPFELGLLGHSDADVALHALMDAMLGACALGDIGKHFPDSDERFRGISSLLLLRETTLMLEKAGYQVHNADITVVAQKPKLLPYVPRMVENIASVLGVSPESINIKATTTEKLGFEGRMEGISAYAVCSVVERNR